MNRLRLLFVMAAAMLPLALSGAKPQKVRAIPPSAPADGEPREIAFEGAEGFGAYSRGGRGGRVLRVTTLEDHGKPGSLRWAVAQSGARIVEFAVEGILSLRQPLVIEQPYLTIDGSTAPGGGITLKDGGVRVVRTHDIIIRHIRVRPGDEAALGKGKWKDHPQPMQGDALSITESADILIDHVSASWATDETISVTHSRRVTVQNCFITEPLANPALHIEEGVPISHAYGALVSGDGVSYLKNYFAYFKIRGPQMSGGTAELPARTAAINNLVAFYENSGTRVKAALEPSDYIVRNNVYRHPLKPGAPDIHLLAARAEKGTDNFVSPAAAAGKTRLYVAGNIGPLNPLGERDGWASVRTDFEPAVAARLRVPEPPFAVEPLTLLPASAVEAHVLAHAGATLPRRDAVDARLVRQFRQAEGKVIFSQDDVGGYAAIFGDHSR